MGRCFCGSVDLLRRSDESQPLLCTISHTFPKHAYNFIAFLTGSIVRVRLPLLSCLALPRTRAAAPLPWRRLQRYATATSPNAPEAAATPTARPFCASTKRRPTWAATPIRGATTARTPATWYVCNTTSVGVWTESCPKTCLSTWSLGFRTLNFVNVHTFWLFTVLGKLRLCQAWG